MHRHDHIRRRTATLLWTAADAHLEIWTAVAEIWPQTTEQRCWNHRLLNVLNKLPKKRAGRSAGPAPKNGPAADCTWPPVRPHSPRQICQPHELLRAQLTYPEPPDVDDNLPSFPARSAEQPPLTPPSNSAGAVSTILLKSSHCLTGVQPVRRHCRCVLSTNL